MENWIDGFLESRGWNAPVVTDENLMMEYPACVYTFADGRRVIALAPEMEEAVPEIPEGASLNEVLDILFDLSEITVHPERVTGFYAPADFPANGEELPDADEAGLHALMDAVSEEDRARGEVTAQDDFTCCIVENGRMLAAAGAVAAERYCGYFRIGAPRCAGTRPWRANRIRADPKDSEGGVGNALPCRKRQPAVDASGGKNRARTRIRHGWRTVGFPAVNTQKVTSISVALVMLKIK